mgnify:FL=1
MKLKYIAFAALLALVSLSSCKDFLDKVPDTRVYLQNVEQLRELMVDGYSSHSYACVGELSSDNVIDNNSPSDNGVRYNRAPDSAFDEQLYRWEPVTMGSDSDSPTGLWEGYYGAIASCNAVLEKCYEFEKAMATPEGPLSETDLQKLQSMKGEALISRAFHHFILANVFCMPYAGPELSKSLQGIPYITEPETKVKPHYDRGTLANVYDHIEADIIEGVELINDGLYEVPKYHFNKAAAYAFAARFYLFKREYEKVVDYATKAFKGNDPATMMNDLWYNSSFYYISDIGRYATRMANASNIMLISSYSTWWRRFVSSGRFACNRMAKRASIQGPGPAWENCRYRNTKTGETFAMMPCFNGYCGTAGGQEYGTYFAGTCFEQFEYTDKIASIGYCHAIRAEFTTEQILLMRAEAYLYLGQKDLAFADLRLWNEAHRNGSNDNHLELTEDQIVKFYTKCLTKYVQNSRRTDLKEKYSDSIFFGIAKPIHIDEICPSDKYKATDELMPWLQCCQHFNRIETAHTGYRWFDIKRLGLEVEHKYGFSDVYWLVSGDTRYAVEVPASAIQAGLEPNNNTPKNSPMQAPVESKGTYVQINN